MTAFTATGRRPSEPSIQRMRFTPLSQKQRMLLDNLKGDVFEYDGRTLTRTELMSIFSGQQIPKDPKLCDVLGLNIDFSALERRIVDSGRTPGFRLLETAT